MCVKSIWSCWINQNQSFLSREIRLWSSGTDDSKFCNCHSMAGVHHERISQFNLSLGLAGLRVHQTVYPREHSTPRFWETCHPPWLGGSRTFHAQISARLCAHSNLQSEPWPWSAIHLRAFLSVSGRANQGWHMTSSLQALIWVMLRSCQTCNKSLVFALRFICTHFQPEKVDTNCDMRATTLHTLILWCNVLVVACSDILEPVHSWTCQCDIVHVCRKF